MRLGCLVGLLLTLNGVAHSAPEMTRPRVAASVIDWTAALASLSQVDGLQAPGATDKSGLVSRLNTASGRLLPTIGESPVPVLLPLDVSAVLRDRPEVSEEGFAAKNDGYFSGFHWPRFFHGGPGGFDTTFTIQPTDFKELADINLHDPVDIHFSGYAFTYEIDEPSGLSLRPVPELEAKFPGIKRFIHEGFVRYSFVRHGAPYVMAIDCFDGRPRILRLLCPQADRIAVLFLSRLQIAGGTPQPARNVVPPAIERPEKTEEAFSYFPPGKIYPGSGFRGVGGRVDYSVWAPIRFPIASAPAYANSQLYRDRPARGKAAIRESLPSDYAYPWRDNFCERRGFTVGQCPSGIGHQGQDLRPKPCAQPLGNDRCDPAHDLVAVRDGVVMRSPKQEAFYIVINNPNEHMRFRYLHMDPRKMDEDNLLSGREVREGEVVGQVSNYSQKENGTSYHLHFDVQLPTKYGWVFVNPYMTLVVAYERLIGGRGVEIVEEPQTRQASETDANKTLQGAIPLPPERPVMMRHEDARKNRKEQAGITERVKTPAE